VRTAHSAHDRYRDEEGYPTTLCGEPWEHWQHPDQGPPLAEALAVPGLTQLEKAQIRAADRAGAGDMVRQCQACRRASIEGGRP
jgi:hypothetical protein